MAKDTIELNALNKVKMPRLKGHVKLILHNCKTGKNEVYEGDNIVTDAVADILGANIAGGVDFNALAPLWSKWFGGVLCYQQTHALNSGNLDPTDYFIKADSTQHVVAHAGQTSIDSEHDDDLSRGNPVGVAYIQTNNSIKQVFEWGSARGNGTISALSLTHNDTGSYGTGGNFYDFINLFCPYDFIARSDSAWATVGMAVKDTTTPLVFYDDSHSLCFFIGDNSYDFSSSSDKLTVYINKMTNSKIGLYQTMFPVSDLRRSFVVTLPFTCYYQPSYYFDYAQKYLWIFHNHTSRSSIDNTNVKYCVIDCENESLVNLGTEQVPVYYKTIISDTSNIAPLSVGTSSRFINANIFISGDYIYLPTSTTSSGENQNITGYKKINISNQSEQYSISLGDTIKNIPNVIGSNEVQILLHRFNSIDNSFVLNGSNAWKCKNNFGTSEQAWRNRYVCTPNNVSTLSAQFNGYDWGGAGSTTRQILVNKLVNTTKFNLPSPVVKTMSQSMTVEYTLTEVTT